MLASTTLTEASILVLGSSSLLVAISVFTLIHNCKARIVFRALVFDEPKTSSDYDVGKGFKLYRGERVTGIMLFDGNGKWRLYTTWNCKGLPFESAFTIVRLYTYLIN